jgi:hypothetical protein
MCRSAFKPMKVAKPSCNQMSSHQSLVTRLPNQKWATSWARTLYLWESSYISSFEQRRPVQNVINPQFSVAAEWLRSYSTKSAKRTDKNKQVLGSATYRFWEKCNSFRCIGSRIGGRHLQTSTASCCWCCCNWGSTVGEERCTR